MRSLIVVPARYGSTRFPGKPLHLIAGRSMVSRVADVARKAADLMDDADYVSFPHDILMIRKKNINLLFTFL